MVKKTNSNHFLTIFFIINPTKQFIHLWFSLFYIHQYHFRSALNQLVGMVKQPTTEQTEFTMSNEDFPALPGTQNNEGLTSSSGIGALVVGNNQDVNDKGPAGAVGMGMDLQSDTMTGNDKAAMKRGVQTSPNGTYLTNVLYNKPKI